MKINMVFPMAGESRRFNYNFKPFLYLDNRRFIEHTLQNFILYDETIASYNFIVTEEQELKYKVRENIHKIFDEISYKINIYIIPKTTSGPYQTLLSFKNLLTEELKNIIICDIDHSVDIKPLINYLKNNENKENILIPTWNIHENEHFNWGKVLLKNDKIHSFYEKEIVSVHENDKIYGIIGCYFLDSLNLLNSSYEIDNITDFLKLNINTLKLKVIPIKFAYFYGTPEMVKTAISKRRKLQSFFFDIDGVLLKHNPHSSNDINNNFVLGNSCDVLKELKDHNNKIILTSARPKKGKKELEQLLKELGIPYDELVLDLNPGPRYLINDIKPSDIFVNQANGINVIRDVGIDHLIFNETLNYNIEVVKKFKGNSFSSTYLLKNNEMLFVRKHIIKNNKTLEHCDRLKRQEEDLQRFYYFDNSLVPRVLNSYDNNFNHYLDLEYLPNHKQLDEFNMYTQVSVVKKLISRLEKNVYCYKKINTNNNFIYDFFDSKIYPKLQVFEKDCTIMNYLINSKKVFINKKEYFGLREVFTLLNIENFNTEYINPIHGDLTLENILYNEENNDIKLIDMEGSRYVDSCYFDLGKIFQSIVSNYKEWNCIDNVIYDDNIDNLTCLNEYFDCDFKICEEISQMYGNIMNVDDVNVITKKGIFFMSTYFIRFVQFRQKINKGHGIFAIIMAVVWLNKLL